MSSTVSPTTFFYGDYIHGYMREYPGHKDGSATCLNGERLDARLQPVSHYKFTVDCIVCLFAFLP